jgi:uncharacterized membrane protein YeaQ/YmgE (transglycosylase-associated protein family)
MDLTTLLVQIVGGAVGGNVAGAAMKDKSLGTIGNSVAGILGGGIGGQILNALGVAVTTGGADLSSLAGNAGTGGVGGAVLLIVIALVRNFLKK